ncbi:MAG: DUF2339 domain-containing protein [Acidobacteriota bacterium]
MAEDLPAEQILQQLIERLELFERVLATNTARLHDIEKHLGIEHQQQRIAELFAAEKRETSAPADQPQIPAGRVKPQDLNLSEAPQPAPVSTPECEPSEQTWPQSQPAEQTSLRSEAEPPQTAGTPPSPVNQASDSHTYATRAADAPFTLHIHVEEPAADTEGSHTAPVREEKRRDLESMVGGSWFNWIGIIAVTFGVAFFLKYAFDKQWIGPVGRVSLAALVGLGLLYLGDRLRGRGLKSYAYVLSGGGVLILYLSNYAAYNFYHLISQPTAFVLMAAVTTTAVLLSVRLDALPVAILGLVGGFLTPLLLSTGVDNEVGLFTYVALLDAGVLAVAYFKRWRSLDFASFAGTVAMTLGWAVKFYEPGKVWTTLFFLSVFFLLYSLLAIFHNVLPGRPTRWFDVALALANASFYFGFSYVMLDEAGFDHAAPATQAFLVSIFFTGLFCTAWRWSPDDLLLRYSYVGAAATFLTVAVGIQLELHWVTMAWAVEALMLTWVGLRSGEKAARHAGLAVFGLAVSHWLIRDLLAVDYSVDSSFVPLLNRRALSCAVLVGAIAGAARLYRRANWEGKLDEDERSTVLTFFALTGNALALTLLSLDINDYFAVRTTNSGDDVRARIENARHFSISVLWTLYGATILAVGVLRRSILLRWGGLLLLLAAISKVLVFDSAFYAASWHLPLLNQTFMAYALLVAALVFAARLYGRAPGVDELERRAMVPIVIVSANVLALAALSLEVLGYYGRSVASVPLGTFSPEISRPFEEGKISTLALVWTIYATYAFMVGVGRSNRGWRLGGLLLLVITTLLVLANLSYYDAPWHTFIFNRTMGVFAVFVAALWLIVRTYARSNEAFEEEPAVCQVAIVAANVLAIIALSAQAAGYYEAKIAEEFVRAGEAALTADATTSLRNLELAKQLSLSVVWAVYASGLFVAGRIRRLRLLRVMALALLSVTTLKVFVWDLSSLDRAYRIISFIMLGAILLVVSYFYQRSQYPVEET